MTADLTIPLPRWPPLDPPGTRRFVGRARPEAVTALAVRMAAECRDAVDADEVAALLEAAGINDRVAGRDYGAPTVFALATMVLARVREEPAVPVVDVRAKGPGARRIAVDTLVRATLYLTPLAVGLGAASEVDGVADLPVTGTLILGWGSGQALAYLGYRALSERGPGAAARLLGGGFALLATVWTVVLVLAGTPWPRGYAVAGAQLAFFAAVGVALVTGCERRVLACAAPCWLSAGALAAGVGRPALIGLLASLVVLIGVAFWPAFTGSGGTATGPAPQRRRWRSWPHDLAYAARYGAVGTGQAVLLVTVALASVTPTRVPLEAVPLLLGVPLIELTLVWHQRRVAAARAALDDRAAFDRQLGRVSAGTTAVLAVPVLVGGGLAIATWLGLPVPGGAPLAAAVLLVAVYALCLVLAAHRRAGTAAALVWWPAILVTVAGMWAPSLVNVAPHFAETLAAATLFGASVPGLAVAALVLRDPESYR